ncbi:P-loop containing nucleoside triphosphate hydrolase protein [Lactarius pseudohatsudake]|nr:P-loop containing nucleoside triphosphate hydrolase protein [Lactarius pseudohatsudake]
MFSLVLLMSIVQPLLTLLNNTVETTQDTTFTNATQNATMSDAAPLRMPTDLSSLLAFIYSMSALRDYLKLIVLGGALETLRRLYSSSYSNFVDRLFITATFESEDVVFNWMMFWLSSLPQWRQFRDFSVSTDDLALGEDALMLYENEDEQSSEHRKKRSVRYLPSYNASYRMWYKGRYVTVSRAKEESRWYSDKSTLTITICSRDRSILDTMILEAREKWMSARSDNIDIYASEKYGDDWNHVASRPKRPLNSIVLDEGTKELLLDDARDFMKSKKWYADRGIPFRRGYLLYGAPGSGKTSIIHSLAGELALDIYIISLSKTGLDDASLNSLICSLPEQCVAIMEDIDAAFTHGITRDISGTDLEDPRSRDPSRQEDDDNPKDSPNDKRDGAKTSGVESGSKITLSGLLNALDGISAQEGRILFATTNRYHTLDPALTRPGRMDLHVEFRLASRYQASELYKRFYIPDTSEVEGASTNEKDDGDAVPSDSGYVTPTKEGSSPTPTPPKSIVQDAPPIYSGAAHSTSAPKLSRKRVEHLAARFASQIPEREFSMASLQGYLMSYKVRPFQAVDDVEQWIKDSREARDRRADARAGRAQA